MRSQGIQGGNHTKFKARKKATHTLNPVGLVRREAKQRVSKTECQTRQHVQYLEWMGGKWTGLGWW